MQMPLQVMDPSKNEGKGKLHKGKKEGSKEKSIVDFFKTPEKDVLVKQKSLLQFFGKTTSISDKNGIKSVTASKEYIKIDKENQTLENTDEHKTDSNGESKTITHRKLQIEEKNIIDVDAENVIVKTETTKEVIVCEEKSDCPEISIIESKVEVENEDDIEIIIDEKNTERAKIVKNSKKVSTITEHQKQEQLIKIDGKEAANNVDVVLDGKLTDNDSSKVADDSVPKVSKRNNLKVKDMLDLLKEVQVCEKLEKKKKSKHRHHKHKSKDTHEVHKGESGMIVSTDADKDTEKCPEINSKSSDEQLKLHANNKDGTERIKKKEHMNFRETIVDMKLEVKECEASEIDCENPNEMSYTDFLAKLSKNETEEMEVDIINVEESAHNEALLGSEYDEDVTRSEEKLVKHESDQMITSFFNFTSTPGKDFVSKKKAKGKKLNNCKAEVKIDLVEETENGKEKKEKPFKDNIGKKGGKSKGLNKEKKENGKSIGNAISLDVDTIDIPLQADQNAEESKARKNQFLQSKVNISLKTTQATLSFGSDGFKISKQNSLHGLVKDQKLKSRNQQTGINHNDKEIDNDTGELNISTSSESAFLTPVHKKTKKRKVPIATELSTDIDESDLAESDQLDSEGKRRSQRKKYKVTVFQMDEDRKTPIKIKLRRCAKSSSTENDDQEKSVEEKMSKVKVNVKQTKAHALLEKAKNRIHKTKLRKISDKEAFKPANKPVEKIKLLSKKKEPKETTKKASKKKRHESEEGNARRSSRLEGKSKVSMEEVSIDNIVISSDEEESAKPVRKKKKKGETTDVPKIKDHLVPVRDKKGKSPVKKTGGKLAPMFLMGKKKSAESPVKHALNPEQAKQRQMFLMSGVPDELKKQTAVRQANTLVSSYPPIPTINHVQQVEETTNAGLDEKVFNVWKLGAVDLKIRGNDLKGLSSLHNKLAPNLVSKKTRKSVLQNMEKPRPFDECTVEKCLNEILTFNPSYPVKMMYKAFKESKLYGEDGQTKNELQELRTDMKGILSEEVGKLESPLKKGKRKSLKLVKKEAHPELVKDNPSSETCVGSSLLWTDKYYPAKASEILGNAGSLKKLKDWLLEWKQVLVKEAKKARKMLLKKKKAKASVKDTKDSDFDSDFAMDSDDSEDDMSLCNTTLLVGPHGAGKTSSVYALAQELGYKVHEVNASSTRSGRQILSQLQEATQSHQVSSQGCHTPSKKKGVTDNVHDGTTQPKSKMALSFTNLLQKQTTQTKNYDVGQKKAKKTKPGKGDNAQKEEKIRPQDVKNKQMAALISEDSNSQSLSPSINLSKTTLILFEEVDVAFEEDKGFLAAVQTFMSTTKIPIILTSTKRTFSTSFDGRYEVINIKRPTVAAVTSHLQTVALIENLRTDFVKLSELVQLYDCDVRQCLLMLQYLVESGGSQDKTYQMLKDVSIIDKTTSEQVPSVNVEKHMETVQDINAEKSDDDLDDFIVLKGRQNKRRRILEDGDSNSGDVNTDKVVSVSVMESGDNDAEARKCPTVYGLGLKCYIPDLIQHGKQSNIDCIKQYLQDGADLPIEELAEICLTYRSMTRTSLFYSHLYTLLPLTLCVTDNVTHLPRLQEGLQKKGKKRKRIMSDLYDSEGSDAEDTSKDKNEELGIPVTDCTETEHGSKSSTNSHVINSLRSFASFYDTMASLDVMRACSDMKTQDRVCSLGSIKAQTGLPPGLDDESSNFTNNDDLESETMLNIESCIETRAFCKLSGHIRCIKEDMTRSVGTSSGLWDEFTLPISRGMDQFQMKDTVSLSPTLEVQRAMNDVKDNLPYTLTKNPRCIHVDYIPALREICRFEKTRLTANTKRRFHHYLDNISLPLRDRTMNILASTFN